MNRFEFMLNLDNYRNAKPKNTLLHDSYDIPKQKIHQIQSDYSRAPKTYKDQISLYEEYNEESLAHSGNYKYYNKIDLPSGAVRYFYTKEEWDAYNKNPQFEDAQYGREKAIKNSQTNFISDYDNTKAKQAKIGPIKTLSNYSKDVTDKIKKDIRSAEFIPEHQKKAFNNVYRTKMNEIENKYKDRGRAIDPDLKHPFRNDFYKLDMDDIMEPILTEAGKKMNKEYITNSDKDEAFRNCGKIMKDMFDDIDSTLDEELTKRENSVEAWENLLKTCNKYLNVFFDDLKEMSSFEKRVLADEMGLDSLDEDDVFKKYGIIKSTKDFEPGDDYGASQFEEQSQIVKEIWNDYKKAKKALNDYSKSEDDD